MFSFLDWVWVSCVSSTRLFFFFPKQRQFFMFVYSNSLTIPTAHKWSCCNSGSCCFSSFIVPDVLRSVWHCFGVTVFRKVSSCFIWCCCWWLSHSLGHYDKWPTETSAFWMCRVGWGGEWGGGFIYVTRFRLVHENNVVFSVFLFLEICLMDWSIKWKDGVCAMITSHSL